ncbi:MAG: hypothetical protein E7405_01215 [Ruminococcaceae bacterium]|nr:hypothetical protein [Oscillospiraceae bacterium]
MEIVENLMFLSVSLIVFFAYRQGIKDSFYINNNLPVTKREEKSNDSKFAKEYEEMLNYEFEMAGEENVQ